MEFITESSTLEVSNATNHRCNDVARKSVNGGDYVIVTLCYHEQEVPYTFNTNRVLTLIKIPKMSIDYKCYEKAQAGVPLESMHPDTICRILNTCKVKLKGKVRLGLYGTLVMTEATMALLEDYTKDLS